jgi:hypothetical protein
MGAVFPILNGHNSTPGLVSTLQNSQDETVKELAAEKLTPKLKQFADHESYMKAVCKNAGKILTGMLGSGTAKGKNHAAAGLSYLALNADNKVELAAIGAIPALVKLAKEGTPELQGASAAALANLSSRCPDNQAALVKAGVIPPLLAIIKTGLGEAKGWAASALGNLALQHKQNQQKVAEAGAIPALLELAKIVPQTEPSSSSSSSPSSGSDLISLVMCKRRSMKASATKNMEMAARALSSLAFDCTENQVKIVKAGGIEAMLVLAQEGSPRDEIEAFRTIGIVWGKNANSEVRERIIKADGLKILLEMVQTASDDSKAAAANMIARLAHEDVGMRASIAANGCIPVLVKLGQQEGAGQARLNAMKALKELSTDCPENQQLIEEAGGATLLATFGGGMKFRELSDEEETQLKEAQARLKEMNEPKPAQEPASDPKHDPS